MRLVREKYFLLVNSLKPTASFMQVCGEVDFNWRLSWASADMLLCPYPTDDSPLELAVAQREGDGCTWFAFGAVHISTYVVQRTWKP